MLRITQEQKIYYALRLAVAMCFIGHGAFGIITKPIWVNYFGVFGFSSEHSYSLMPVVGIVDILLGVAMLLYPVRAIAAWLVIWGMLTAMLRPLSGEPFPEFIERAGNFGAPLALLLLAGTGNKNSKGWFTKIRTDFTIDESTFRQLMYLLRVVAFLLLLGHGWLNLIEKKGLLDQYSFLGFSNAALTAQAIGIFEILAAFAVLIRPVRSLVLGLFIWKMMSELFYPQYEVFEWIERGGSYGVLLALWFGLKTPVHQTWLNYRGKWLSI